MKREYQELINLRKKQYAEAKTPEKKRRASIALRASKSVINAYLFNPNEMKMYYSYMRV